MHLDTIKFCQTILQQKPVEWRAVNRNDLSQPISDVDLVVTIGGDGTLLQACHFMDDTIPVLGVNSDPTRTDEVHIAYSFGCNVDTFAPNVSFDHFLGHSYYHFLLGKEPA